MPFGRGTEFYSLIDKRPILSIPNLCAVPIPNSCIGIGVRQAEHFIGDGLFVMLKSCLKWSAKALGLCVVGLNLLGIPDAIASTNVDLGVSAYTWTPDPVVHSGTSTFSVTVTNNDVATSADTLTLAINLPTNISFSNPAPANCAYNLASTPNTLTCTNSLLAAQGTWIVNFNGVGATAGVQTTSASISSSTNVDSNSGNDTLTKNTTVINGADLAVVTTGAAGCTSGCSALANSTYSFSVNVSNATGPDSATTFQVVDNLPATTDFTYSSAGGTNWACVQSVTTVTCDYSGPNIASGSPAPSPAPPITITGTVITTSGTITNSASVASTDGSTGDPVVGNNTTNVVVAVTQTTDLRANKTMVSAATGLTSLALGEAVNLTLSVTNQGPRDATGVTITDVVPAGFGIGTHTGCSLVSSTLTCTVGNLANGATSSNFNIVLTSPSSSGSGTNTATPGRTLPVAGANNTASVSYTVAAATANLVASKSMVSTLDGATTYAYGEGVTLTLGVTNNGPQNATGVTITDVVPAGFVIDTLPLTPYSGCTAIGQTITCTVGNLNNGVTSSNFVIPLTAPSSSSSGTNTATPGSALPGTLTTASVNYTVAPPSANLRANKTMVSAAPGSTSGTTTYVVGQPVTLTLSVTNNGLQAATGVTITDTVPADFSFVPALLPAGCNAVGQVISCTVANLANGATSANFNITLTALNTNGGGNNTATESRTSPSGGSDTASNPVSYSIISPYAHLTLTKTKTPALVAAGANITNTITVTNSNNSSSTATGTIRVTDVLDPNETFVSASPAAWSCSGTTTITCDYAGASLARGVSLTPLVITTQGGSLYLGPLSNTACTGSSAGSPHLPADNSGTGNCATATNYATPRHVDLSIVKTASIASPTHILATDTSFTYTLTVSNANPDVAPTVNVSDPLPGYINGLTTGSAVITGAGTGESCAFGSTVTCTLKNVTSGSPRIITITVNRQLTAGSYTNTATLTTPDAIDTTGPKQGSVAVIIDPVADVLVTLMTSTPNPVKVGVQVSYNTSIKNNGPDPAAGVVLRQVIDPARMVYVANSASLTIGGTCSYVSSFSGAPYAGLAGIECSGISMSSGNSGQLSFKVIPFYPYPDALPATYTSVADMTTTTGESNSVNNNSNSIQVTTHAIDLSVTDNDTNYDPTNFGSYILYQAKAQNNGPSQATGFTLTEQPNAPSGGTPSAYTMVYDSSHSIMPAGYSNANCSQSGTSGPVTCYLNSTVGTSILPANSSALFQLAFTTGPSADAPSSSITYSSTATVSSYETGTSPFAGDTLPGNNSVSENTTVLPITDLQVYSKTVDHAIVDLNQTFIYTIMVGNKGPSIASGVVMTDVLPAGFVLAAAPSGFVATSNGIRVTPGSNVTLTANSCTAPAVSSNGTVTCTLGNIPADTTGTDTTKMVAVSIPVRAAYVASGTYSFGSGGASFTTNPTPAITNTASVAPVTGTSVDTTPGNNSNTVTVQVQKNSIAGYVYADNDLSGTMLAGGGEGIGSVTLTLTGTDSYGNTYGGSGACTGFTYCSLTATTSPTAGVNKGSFLFDKLPPGSWTVVETQPANYWDSFETAGTAAGTVPTATCDGVVNCVSSGVNVAAANTISGITLPSATLTTATGYLFQEYQKAQISGNIYIDANDDGIKSGAAETGINISPATAVTLSGLAYNGLNVCSLVTCTASAPSGAFSYTNLPPSDASGYTVTETQPAAYLNGITTAGTVTGTNSVAGTATGANSDVIQAIKVYSNGISINNNFGELQPASLNGYVFIDSSPATPDAQRSGTELAGVVGLTITLTGIDDLGASVNTPYTTVSNGALGGGYYNFTNLRPGTYTVTETTTPVGLTHTGAQAGSKGGTIGSSVTAANIGVTGSGNTAISAITVVSNDTAAGYNFGEYGQGLSGYVYIDLNSNGTKDTSEPGIAGVSVTLSGTTAGTQDVCVEIYPNPCTLTTDSSGHYSFVGLPASDGTGYTLTEQSQTTPPLNNYADGLEQLGTGLASPGTANNDNFTGIVLPVGGVGANYNFGELGAKLSGTVYYDANDNGVMDGTDTGLASVTLTLSGTTASGVSVCTLVTCGVTTAADGTFSYTGLPAANATGYTLVETQPVDYANGTDTVGTGCGGASCGTASVVGGNSQFAAIKLTVGANAVNYYFGEKTGAISGFVYLDANDNAAKDTGETGIAGVTLTLSGTTLSNAAVCTTCTTTTAADGSYSFTGIKNANGSGYTITETQPGAYLHGKVTAGTQHGTVTNTSPYTGTTAQNSISAIAFSAASPATAYNFGQLQSVSISGFVYADINNDGILQTGEELANVTLTLTGTDDLGATVNQTTTTNASGAYSFSGLRPSNASGYTVTETQPSGYGEYSTNTGTQVGTISSTSVGSSGAGANVISGIILPSGGTAINYNFRESSSSIAGTVYVDVNTNGTLDGADTRLSGITVSLSGTAAATTTTDASGNYSFTKLTSGTYTVTETQPSGYVDFSGSTGTAAGTSGGTPALNATSAISLSAGIAATGYNFREQSVSTISGKVYIDANNDGVYQTTETGLVGVTITLSGTISGGADICSIHTCTTLTDTSGNYTFISLPAGTYTLTETQPTQYGDGKESAGTPSGTINNAAFGNTAATNQIASIALGAPQDGVGYNFGELGSSLAGTVYVDANNDGILQGTETKLSGVSITLSGTSTSGSDVCTLITSCTTNSNVFGIYSFTGLPSGTYTLTETQPTAYADGKESVGTPAGTVNNSSFGNTAATNQIASIPLGAGKSGGGYNFGELTGSLTGLVYNDANGNGSYDSVEPGIAGVTLTLTGTDSLGNSVSQTVQTDTSGNYSFTGLLSADGSGYTITETQPASWNDGQESKGLVNGSVCSACNTSTINKIQGIPFQASNTYTGYNFGEVVPLGSIAGKVFIDANGNGAPDTGETPLVGVTVNLSGYTFGANGVDNGGTGDDVAVTASGTTTDTSGNYSFTGLLPGKYTVTEPTQPPSTANGITTAGSAGGTATGTGTTPSAVTGITLSGTTATAYNFGEISSGSVSGSVYLDANSNSVKDSGEALAGVSLSLTGTDDLGGAVNLIAITNTNGIYTFANLRPSNGSGYTVTETQPAGYGDFPNNSGTVAGTVGGTSVLNATSSILLIPGTIATGYDFRETGASLSGKVYVDANNSGIPDTGETGLAGINIALSGAATATTTTDANGNYSFANLIAGNYTLTETQPAAYGDGKESAGTPPGSVNNSAFGNTAATNQIANIPLGAGQGGVGYNFGELTGSLNGTVYNDLNANGSLDTGEPGIQGVSLTLTGTDTLGNPVSKTVSTDANGNYSFTGLLTANAAGYTITETQPAAYLDGQDSKGLISGVVCAVCNIATANNIKSIPFQPDSGFTGYNFGEVQSASIAGLVYHDVNKNGVQDAGEPGLGLVTLTLTGTNDLGVPVNTTIQTAADGTYLFSGLRPSNGTGYIITETQPAGINNFSGNSGTHTGSAGGTAALDQVSGIVLGSGVNAISYDFREDASIFANGVVYLDANDDGIRQAGETGIANVTVTLTATGGGHCADGTTTCTTTTASDGTFNFGGLSAGTYTLTETQPIMYQDGRETVGSAGGTVDNSSFGSAPAQNQISNIVLSAGTPGTGYLFGDLPGVRASVSGRVWVNTASTGTNSVFDPGDTPLGGWIVQVMHGGTVLASTATAADGTYLINTVSPDYNYSVQFVNPANGRIWAGPVVNGGVGTANSASIDGITVPSNGKITGLDLPIDPSGVVYDAVTRASVQGATVTISGPAGFNPATDVIGGSSSSSQITGADGFYQFWLTSTAPAGTYTLSVIPPAGYLSGVSSLIPPTTGTLSIGTTTTGMYPIQAQATPPTGGQVTTYYLAFGLSSTSANVTNNHIPVDPVANGSIVMTKTTPLVNVAKGDLVPYTLTATNVMSIPSSGIGVRDQMPPGFKYRVGSATLNGLPLEPTVSGRMLTWNNLAFAASEKKTFKLMLTVGTGVNEGSYTNQTWALNDANNTTISNVAEAVVKVVPDPTFDCSDLIGKVFDDRNANGYQDQGEPGIPNVRIATVRGLLVTTDADGRFHVACADIPQAGIGSNFIVKLDERTLPSGFRLTTENPRVVRTTNGTMVKLNFGATIHKVFRLELDGRAFVPGEKNLLKDWDSKLKLLMSQLSDRPSVLRIAYRAAGDEDGLISHRIDALEKQVKELYKIEKETKKGLPPLLIETEIFGKTGEMK